MAGKGREVADAYIEVHGDLSKFRRDLEKARPAAEKAGEQHSKAWTDAFEKRSKRDLGKKMDSIWEAAYSRKGIDWDRAFGQFDSKNLDNARAETLSFLKEQRDAGTITGQEFKKLKGAIQQASEASRDASKAMEEHNSIIAWGKKLREESAKQQAISSANSIRLTKQMNEELKRFNGTWEGMNIASQDRIFEKNYRRLADFMNGADVGPNMQSREALDDFRTKMIVTAEAARDMGKMAGGEFDHITTSLMKLNPEVDKFNKRIGDGSKNTGLLHKITEKLRVSWARMDGTVKMVMTLIASAAGPMAAGLSGLAASGTALVSSVAMAAASVVPLAAAFSGIALTIGLAASSMESMKKKFPGIEAGAKRVGKAWEAQAVAFGAQWGGALEKFLSTFATKLGKYNFGKAFGQSMSGITDAFTAVLKSPGFDAFLKTLTTDIPAAVEGFGKGLASTLGGLTSLLAGAAPAAKALGADFEGWGAKFSKSMESMRNSGKLEEVFGKARESLLAVLDLTGSLGGALGSVFMAGADSGNRLLGSLTAVVDQWNDWMGTVEGKNAMAEWFANGERIIKSFEPVVVGLAKALDTMVTPHSIGQFENLMSSIGEILPMLADMLMVVSNLGILNILAEAFKAVGSALQPLMGPLGEITKALGGHLQDAIKALSPLFAAIGQALAPFIEGIGKIVSIVGPVLAPAISKISEALSPVIAIIGQVAGVIIGVLAPVLGGLLVGIINNIVGVIQGLSKVFMGVVEVIKGVFGVIVGIVTGDGAKIGESFKMIFNGLWGIVSGAFEAIWNAVQLILIGKVFAGIKAFLMPLKGVFTGAFNGVKAGIIAIWNGIGTFFTMIWTSIRTIFTSSTAAVSGVVSRVFSAIGGFIKGALDEALFIVTTVLNGIRAGFTGAMKFIGELWTASWTAIRTVAVNIFTAVRTKVTEIVTAIKTKIKAVMDATKAVWSTIWTAIRTKVTQIVDAIKAKVSAIMDGVKSKVSSVMNSIKSTWSNIWTAIRTKATEIINAVKSKVSSVLDSVKSKVSSVMNSIKSTFSNIWNSIKTVVSNAVNSVKSKVTSALNSIRSTVSSKMNSVKTAFSNAWNAVKSKISDAMGQIKSKVSSGISNVVSTVRGLPGKARAALGSIGSTLVSAGGNMIRGFIQGVKNKASDIAGAALSAVKGAVSAVKGFLGIRSPSRLFRKFGGYTGQGMAMGMDDENKNVASSAMAMAEAAVKNFEVSKMIVAGRDAAKGFADGMEKGKGYVTGAMGKMTAAQFPVAPVALPSFGAPRAGATAPQTSTGATNTTVIETVQVHTPATDGGIVALQMLDEVTRKIGG